MTPAPKPPGFVHVDLDGLWTLAGAYGYEEGQSFQHDPIFAFALPRLLDLLDQLRIKATFFIVGRDLEHPQKRESILQIASRGHDFGNHSYSHTIGLEALEPAIVFDEIARTQDLIMQVTGRAPLGFRAPGYDAGEKVFEACGKIGLIYDGSSLPTRWGPLLRWGAEHLRSAVEKEALIEVAGASGPGLHRQDADAMNAPPSLDNVRSRQYGPGSGGPVGIAPEWIRTGNDGQPLLRLPLAVSPVLRLPLHASIGMLLGEPSVRSGLNRLAARGWPITYLLHGMDAAAPEDYMDHLPKPLSKSNALNVPLTKRLKFLEKVLTELKELTRIQLTRDYLESTGELGLRS